MSPPLGKGSCSWLMPCAHLPSAEVVYPQSNFSFQICFNMPRRRHRRKRQSKSVARRALRLARKAWQATDHEVKVLEAVFDDFVLSQTSTFQPLLVNGLTEGVSQDQRIGERVALLRLQLRLVFQKNGDNSIPSTSVRFMVVWDKQNNGGVFTPNNLLENTLVSVGNQDVNLHSMYNAQQRTRFSILLDKTMTLNDGHNTERVVKWSVPLHRRQVQYNGAANAAANIITGGLYICAFGSITDGGSQSLLSGQTRLWYID